MPMIRRGTRAVMVGLVASLVLAGTAHALQVGQKAPDFTLAGPGGKPVKLSELLGKGPIVLYTFIQAFTKT
jgi:thioredoxin-dependent peroxiredoxin